MLRERTDVMFSGNEIEEGKKNSPLHLSREKKLLSLFGALESETRGLPVQAAQCFTKPHS